MLDVVPLGDTLVGWTQPLPALNLGQLASCINNVSQVASKESKLTPLKLVASKAIVLESPFPQRGLLELYSNHGEELAIGETLEKWFQAHSVRLCPAELQDHLIRSLEPIEEPFESPQSPEGKKRTLLKFMSDARTIRTRSEGIQ